MELSKVKLSYSYNNHISCNYRNSYIVEKDISSIFKSKDIENEIKLYIQTLPEISHFVVFYEDIIVYSIDWYSTYQKLQYILETPNFDFNNSKMNIHNSHHKIEISYIYKNKDRVKSYIVLKDVFLTNDIENDINTYIKNLPDYNDIEEWTVKYNDEILLSNLTEKIQGYFKLKYILMDKYIE